MYVIQNAEHKTFSRRNTRLARSKGTPEAGGGDELEYYMDLVARYFEKHDKRLIDKITRGFDVCPQIILLGFENGLRHYRETGDLEGSIDILLGKYASKCIRLGKQWR